MKLNVSGSGVKLWFISDVVWVLDVSLMNKHVNVHRLVIPFSERCFLMCKMTVSGRDRQKEASAKAQRQRECGTLEEIKVQYC